VAKLRERISVSKRARQNFDLEGFDMKKDYGKVPDGNLKNSRQINGDNLQNVRRETSRTFRNKKREYLKGKINEL
jgi:hypothetical protein